MFLAIFILIFVAAPDTTKFTDVDETNVAIIQAPGAS